jgi:UDP-N-acetyl-2-amino-2-deoxyglucuronate dehydrogenase
MTASIGIGIVGCGGAAVDLARAIDSLPDVHLAAAYDRVRDLAAELCEPRRAAIAGDLEELLRNPAVAVVYVAVPHDQLAAVTAKALEAGKHVLAEKPMALDPETIRSLERHASDQRRSLGVVFQLRASAAAIESRRLIESGAIGDIQLVRIRTLIDKPPQYWQSGPTGRVVDGWRSRRDQAGGGVVLMNSIHQLDVVRYMTGLEFVRASGETATNGGLDVEDRASASLRLSNGGIVNLVASAFSPGAQGEEQIEIEGSTGRLDLSDPYASDSLRVFLRQPAAGLAATAWTDVALAPRDSLSELLRAFVGAVRGVGRPLATAGDAAAALAAVRAIYSSAEGGHSVDIPASGPAEMRSHA